MDSLTWAVLAVAVAASTWLVAYVRLYLPQKLEDRFLDSMKAFSTAIELRFPSHEGLSLRVVSLSQAVGRQLGLSNSELRELEMAARLRDIGLCSIPYSLVNGKQARDWSLAETMTYSRHAEVSGAMLEMVPSLRHLADVVRWHHARYDGHDEVRGTPLGRELPLDSRILKVVTDYVWRERWQGDVLARDAIRTSTATIYCPEAAEALWGVLTSSRVAEPERVAVA
jgi:response regulator RpfG family c-di-GMP phosphodiesterase